MSDSEESNAAKSQAVFGWKLIPKFFEGLQWLTEKVISLLRLFVTAAMFLVVAFVIYNAWVTRNTVAVKSFQVPVSMGEHNHEQAGRIIANLLNRHLLEAQDNLQSQLNRDGIDVDRPVAAEQQVLIEGESIKLPETGITIDNVVEFISGIFGRKNLNGSVYYESDLKDASKTKLYLQITLRGRIISFSEDDLGEVERKALPETQSQGLNIQLISAMLKARSKDILGIASEDYNLYYYCTRATGSVEHTQGDHKEFFNYCSELQDANATPKTLQELKTSLDKYKGQYNKSIVGSVIAYLQDESHKKQATLCQSTSNKSYEACQGINLADARPLTKISGLEPLPNESVHISNTTPDNAHAIHSSHSSEPVLSIVPAMPAIRIDSLAALGAKCDLLRTSEGDGALDSALNIVRSLENQCFPETPFEQRPQQQVQQNLAAIASPAAIVQSGQAESDGKQLFNNGLYAEAMAKYQESILHNCNYADAWANLGILLSKTSIDSGFRDAKQGECALLRATALNDTKGWVRHSLCVAQANQAVGDLERFLSYESCQLARSMEPAQSALYDRLFYIDIGDRYRELKKYDKAVVAYQQSMSNERVRSCSMKKVVESLLALKQKGVENAGKQACDIYKATSPELEQKVVPECEVELNVLVSGLGCV